MNVPILKAPDGRLFAEYAQAAHLCDDGEYAGAFIPTGRCLDKLRYASAARCTAFVVGTPRGYRVRLEGEAIITNNQLLCTHST